VRPRAVAVVVPARDEEALVEACLASVLAALDAVAVPSVVVLVAHRCTDRTAERAAAVLGGRGVVVADGSDHVVGARRHGMDCALRHFAGTDRRALWLLSTDADTCVPPGWVADTLGWAADGAAAVAGTAELDAWRGSATGLERYRRLVAERITGATHRHAYAANLAVRADAYLGVGGWPRVRHGEDHALLAALDTAGWPVHRPAGHVVVTSGRRVARASDGLADLLARLDPDAGLRTAGTATP
jgi:cellulose synthase/poly-beta-1,6-N-acetylglucosamine synthase-like glycosyltransferase